MQTALPFNTRQLRFEFPPIFSVNHKIRGNSIEQLGLPIQIREVTAQEYKAGRLTGYLLTPIADNNDPVLAITNSSQPPDDIQKCLRINKIEVANEQTVLLGQTNAKWIKHPLLGQISRAQNNIEMRLQEAVASWKDAFSFLYEDQTAEIPGLRNPQIGAIHAVHAHWSVTDQAATVVMPTGTGKTEVMLSLLVSQQCHRLLVIVPTDALRSQIAGKFIGLGILKEFGIVSDNAQTPIVGMLKHKPRNIAEVDEFFEKCNVVVTTMNIAGQCGEEVQSRIAELCDFLFIDEAHHVPAKTWSEFKQYFSDARILQFTATPFRQDGKSIEGKVIFNYPLKKAQDEGYFRPISFKPIIEYDPAKRDIAIAEAAVAQLREDLEKGHILMARVGTTRRAEQVLEIYRQYPEFNPVMIHSSLPKRTREEVRNQILSGAARIVVCINMLGEGFDLPELKIAAFHDIRKSLPVTLQLAGRFTRARSDLGDPTFIANLADVEVAEELRMLYIQDPDWNTLLPQASKAAIEEETNLWEFLEGFEKFPEDISLLNFRPAMSTVVYKTRCQTWEPENFKSGIRGAASFDNLYHDVNQQTNTLVIVTNKKMPVAWARMDEIYTWEWELYIVFWDEEQSLLFIHSSTNSGYFADLAKAVAGQDVEQIRGVHVFRCFSGVNRLRLQNVGLLKTLGRLIRYEMRAGSDIEPALTEAERRNTIKANIFGAGFEHGQKTTIGCSYKGRLWSRRTTNLRALSEWCSNVGRKLIDETIDPDEVLKGTLVPEEVFERPNVMPIGIEWPEMMYIETETAFYFTIAGIQFPLHFADINLTNPTEDGELRFEIRSNETAVEFQLNIIRDGELAVYSFSQVGEEGAEIVQRSTALTLTDFFDDNPPIIWFADGSSLQGNIYIQLKQEYLPFPREKVEAWDWEGINIRKESQGATRETDSIQYRVIDELKKQTYSIIFDDDGSGEAADVIAILEGEEKINVQLYHCKYSQNEQPGQRIKDMYEVCGQAQKSIRWADRPTEFFSHLLRREPRRAAGQEFTRFEVGTPDDLLRLHAMSRRVKVEFEIIIVQPGLSKRNASNAQLELLSVTENYLMEIYMIPFRIIASP